MTQINISKQKRMRCCDCGSSASKARSGWIFEEENVQFWFDVAFEWQYLGETVPINLEDTKEIWTDVNQIFVLFWRLFRWSMVGLAWIWIGRRVEVGGQYFGVGWRSKIAQRCQMKSTLNHGMFRWLRIQEHRQNR